MDRGDKLNALRYIGMAMQGDGAVVPVLSFLAGRLDKVHFVMDTEGADVSIHLAVSSRVWPRIPCKAVIDGTVVNHPFAIIDRLALRDDEIYVRVDFGVLEPPEWFKNVLESGVQDPRQYLEGSIQRIREQIDLALDVYRTASELVADAEDEQKREYLRFALEKAREEIRALSAKLRDLELQMQSIGS